MSDRKSVLAIDDDDQLLYLLKMSLESFGNFEVTTAVGGVQGCRLAEARRWDVIISDLIMPDLDGEKVVERIRQSEHNKETLLFVLSGTADLAEALQMQNVIVVSKPFEPKDLVGRIDQALSSAG